MLHWYYDLYGEVSGNCNETVILCERCATELGLRRDIAADLDYDDYPCCEWCDTLGMRGGTIPEEDDDEGDLPQFGKIA